MTSLRALVLSMSVVVSRALQTHSHDTKNDWDKLAIAFNSDVSLGMYKCSSPQYEEFVKSLPPVDFSRVKIPHNKRILFYGTSLLHQALQNILVANGDVLIKDGPLGGYEGKVLSQLEDKTWSLRAQQTITSKMDEQRQPGLDVWQGPYEEMGKRTLTGYVVKWDFAVNSSITEVQNYAPLQKPESDEVVGNLAWYMKEHQFDIAFFMNPHMTTEKHFEIHDAHKKCLSECRAKQLLHMGEPADKRPKCDATTCPDPPDKYRGRKDASKLWDVFQEAMPGKVYQVEEWDFHDAMRDEWFHADREHVIKSFDIFANRFCGVADDCEQHALNYGGHQCQPGSVIQVAERLVAKMNGL